jgi:hypothetical protein
MQAPVALRTAQRTAVLPRDRGGALRAPCQPPCRLVHRSPSPPFGSGGGPRTCTPTVTLDQHAATVDLGENWPGTTYAVTGGAPRIRAIDDDCQTTYYPVPRAFRLTQKPAGSAATLAVSGPSARITTDKLGVYGVAVDLCPGGCVVLGKSLPMRTMSYKMTAVSTKNLPPQTRPGMAKQPQTTQTPFCHRGRRTSRSRAPSAA